MRYILNGILLEIVRSFRYEGEETRSDLRFGDQCFELRSIHPTDKNKNGHYSLILDAHRLSNLEHV